MSIKRYCDICGKETSINNVHRNVHRKDIIGTYYRVEFTISDMRNGEWHQPDLCKECVNELINKSMEK